MPRHPNAADPSASHLCRAAAVAAGAARAIPGVQPALCENNGEGGEGACAATDIGAFSACKCYSTACEAACICTCCRIVGSSLGSTAAGTCCCCCCCCLLASGPLPSAFPLCLIPTILSSCRHRRVESIMVSAPPLIAWKYNVQPQEGSQEAALVELLRQPREWA